MIMSTTLACTTHITVSEKVDGKFQEVGKVEVGVPSLAQFGIDAEPTKVGEDGIPQYATNELNWLMGAALAQAKAQARNKLQPKTAQVKPGLTIATTLEALTAPSIAGGNAETLKAITAIKKDFGEYVNTLGLATKAAGFLIQGFGSPNSLAMQPAALREKMEQYVSQFAEWMGEEGKEAGPAAEAYLEKVLAACEEEEELSADMF